jgi:hypothetical protein
LTHAYKNITCNSISATPINNNIACNYIPKYLDHEHVTKNSTGVLPCPPPEMSQARPLQKFSKISALKP